MKIALPIWLWSGAAFAADLEPRIPLKAMSPIMLPTGQAPDDRALRLGIKFVDHARARATPDGHLSFGSSSSSE